MTLLKLTKSPSVTNFYANFLIDQFQVSNGFFQINLVVGATQFIVRACPHPNMTVVLAYNQYKTFFLNE